VVAVPAKEFQQIGFAAAARSDCLGLSDQPAVVYVFILFLV
jgi:hypothetical protein